MVARPNHLSRLTKRDSKALVSAERNGYGG